MTDDDLISRSYADLNAELHRRSDGYGSSAGARWGDEVARVCREVGAESAIDYGCGKGTLKPALSGLCPDVRVREYDPAVPGKTATPRTPADVVACLDVLEHVEPDRVPAVLDHVARLSRSTAVVTVCTRPASEHKLLADGRNPHQCVRPLSWWVRRLSKRFREVDHRAVGDHEYLITAKK